MAGFNLGTAYVQIMPSAKGIGGELSKALSGDVSSAGTSAGGLLGGNIVKAAMGAIAAAGIGAAVGKLFKSALDAGGALQQSFGGLETIYGDAAEGMKKMSYEAAQAGISANDYAEQAVSFGASLKQAFGGDTVKAAEAANTAIMDMADNSAKMGTDMSAIQNAYQGFAKQNYTMLDNLKLGYGGTKSEMERLLADATKLSGVEYNIDNLGDVYEAIHVVQEELGLTGVAAQEGAETFTGSMGAMKASAENLLANMATGGDITEPLMSLIENARAFLVNNLFPMIGNIIQQIPAIIGEGLNWIFNNVPGMIDSVISFLTNITNGIKDNSGQFHDAMVEMGHKALEMFKSIDWKGLGLAIINLLWEGIKAIAPVIWDLLKWIGTTAWNWFKSVDWKGLGHTILNLLLTGLKNLGHIIWEALKTIASTAWEWFKNVDWLGLGLSVLYFIVNGIWQGVQALWDAMSRIVIDAWNYVTNIDWAGVGRNIINGIINGISRAGGALIDTLLSWANAAWQSVKNFFGIASPSKLFADSVGAMIPLGIAEGIEDEAGSVTGALEDIAKDSVDSIDTSFAYDATHGALADTDAKAQTGGITINVYPSAGMDERQLADMVQQRLTLAMRQKQAAWGTA